VGLRGAGVGRKIAGAQVAMPVLAGTVVAKFLGAENQPDQCQERVISA